MNLNPLNSVRSLLGKMLLALLASTALALLLVSIIQRHGLRQGFEDFLQRQEVVQLSYLVPELQQWYERRGSWETLRGNTRQWLRLLARARPEGIVPPEDARLAGPVPAGGPLSMAGEHPHHPSPAGPPPDAPPAGGFGDRRHGGHGPADELHRLWRRMFLLDADRAWVAGAPFEEAGTKGLQAIEVAGVTVGWVGFVRALQPNAPEARRFLSFQRNTLLAAAGVALLASALAGFLLARHLTRPVEALRDSVQALTAGDYSVRTAAQGQDEIAELGRHINRLAETLQANESARRRWTADVAHELRTPLAILQAEIEAARDGVRSDTESTLASLHEEVRHLSALVDDLQLLALADAGALDMRLGRVDLAALLGQVLDSLRGRLQQAGLQLELQAPPQLVIQADAQRLRQLLLNLLENSCRYTDRGGHIRVVLESEGPAVRLAIADSAPGLSPEQCERLFERFYRVDSSRNRTSGGSGLGLSICREIVLAHGGAIHAQPSELGGLAVVVTLPRSI
jgi:two-component system sensor histidine kinase BaeS